MNVNSHVFLTMYAKQLSGQECAPRGEPIKEVEDAVLRLDGGQSPCTSFKARKFSLPYAKAEMVWYLRGDPYDTYIESRSSIWPKIKQPGNFYFSQYGNYLFREGQLKRCVDDLTYDEHSRRASVVLLRLDHLFRENKDVVCTYSMSFRIRRSFAGNRQLNMSVNMRSNDAIYGTTNDCFAFNMCQRIVQAALNDKYPGITLGKYVHKVDSLHTYQRHWSMLQELVEDDLAGYTDIPIPSLSGAEEANFLLNYHADRGMPKTEFQFTNWMMDH